MSRSPCSPARSRIRRLATWGPHPTQPLVAASHVEPAVRREAREALLALRHDAVLNAGGLAGFAPVTDADYGDYALPSGWNTPMTLPSGSRR